MRKIIFSPLAIMCAFLFIQNQSVASTLPYEVDPYLKYSTPQNLAINQVAYELPTFELEENYLDFYHLVYSIHTKNINTIQFQQPNQRLSHPNVELLIDFNLDEQFDNKTEKIQLIKQSKDTLEFYLPKNAKPSICAIRLIIYTAQKNQVIDFTAEIK